ncbi:MAG: DUF1667 domain-containing protein [Gammaproteobacteria bacterium]|nr:DUF1667 domain-containing protein [Gammaproteobacteria bacterium]
MSTTEMTCICCPIGCSLSVEKAQDGYQVSGNKCPRGKKYAIEELTAPKRIVTSTVALVGGQNPVISVKTKEPVLKEKIFEIMNILSTFKVNSPVKVGQTIIKNIANSGVDIVATKNA